MENEFNELVFHVWKTSPLSSFSYPQQVARAASALDQIVSSAGWLRLFVVKKSIQGKRSLNSFSNQIMLSGLLDQIGLRLQLMAASRSDRV